MEVNVHKLIFKVIHYSNVSKKKWYMLYSLWRPFKYKYTFPRSGLDITLNAMRDYQSCRILKQNNFSVRE